MLDILPSAPSGFGDEDKSDIWLLENSGVFDASLYRALAGISDDVNAARHYLTEGWRHRLEPGANFEGSFLFPYYRSVGLSGPPALSYMTLVAAGGLAELTTRAKAEQVASVVRHSEVFDAVDYTSRVGSLLNLDPAMHYVLVGEVMGYAPSRKFDPEYYRERYPDVARVANAVHHYELYGRREGRRPVGPVWRLPYDVSRIDPARETVLVICHQATRTGAPILGYNIARRLRRQYNVVAVLLSGGELVADFQDCCEAVFGPLTREDWHPVDIRQVARRLLETSRLKYVIANSVESAAIVSSLAIASVPVVMLVHEFAASWPENALSAGINWSTQLVFSSAMTAAAAVSKHPILSERKIHILPQGQSELPPRAAERIANDGRSLRAAMRPPGAEDAFVVLGCGTITMRKGVEFFLSCAAAVRSIAPKRPVRFVWIGSPSGAEADNQYLSFIAEQIMRSGLRDMVGMVSEVADLSVAYRSADAFFVSSRLDPLPNVAIDASLHGLPVVCFQDGTGFAELLLRDPKTSGSVVPYLDAHAAAGVIAKLADDDVAYGELSDATRLLAQRTFDLKRYVAQLDEIGCESIAIVNKRLEDLDTLRQDDLFDENMFLPPDMPTLTRDDAIVHFLVHWVAAGLSRQPTTNFYFRRPCLGFHPQIYAYENAHLFDAKAINPLAHFIRSGQPEGPWKHEVLSPSDFAPRAARTEGMRIALHGHFYYPELASDFLEKLAINQTRCDLFLSTTDEEKAALLRRLTSHYSRGKVTIRIVPNLGRDIGAFLTEFADDLLGEYDVVGHVHSKRSLLVSEAANGDAWREFLWQNLLGHTYPMMDGIVERFARDEGLGIVFPEDPHLCDWDYNLEIATDLARKMGIQTPLAPFFNFPVGTMFWARAQALAPLFALGLGWDDYPKEPVPIDGTVLHAIERLLPFVAQHAGYRYAATHIPGVTW